MPAKLENFHIDVYVYYVCGTLKDNTPIIVDNCTTYHYQNTVTLPS